MVGTELRLLGWNRVKTNIVNCKMEVCRKGALEMWMNISHVYFCIGRNNEIGWERKEERKNLLSIMLDNFHLSFQKNSNLRKETQGFLCVYMCLSLLSLHSLLFLSRSPSPHLCFLANDLTVFNASASSPVKEEDNNKIAVWVLFVRH